MEFNKTYPLKLERFNLEQFAQMKYFYSLIILFLFNACQEKEIKLFNSSNLDGWVNYGGGKFYVEDGCIVAESINNLPNTFLHTEKNTRTLF